MGDDDLWRGAAAFAANLHAAEAFVAGLRLVSAGEALITRLALPKELAVSRRETLMPSRT